MLTTSSSSITASLTTDVPVWVPSKSGWYDSSTGVQRYIGGSATDFNGKWIYETGQQNRIGTFEEQNNKLSLKMKIIKIGNWDMKATERKTVSHGLNLLKIRGCRAIIINDISGALYDLNRVNEDTGLVAGSIRLIEATDITLQRASTGYFQSTDLFDSSDFDRGWVILWYEV